MAISVTIEEISEHRLNHRKPDRTQDNQPPEKTKRFRSRNQKMESNHELVGTAPPKRAIRPTALTLVEIYMKKHLSLALMLPALAWAEQFQVTDLDSGSVYGPFTYTNGTILSIHTNRLELKRISTKADLLTERLKTIMIPSIEFRNANIHDVINFLVEASIASDEEKTGANIILSRIMPDPSGETNSPRDLFQENFDGNAEYRPIKTASDTDSITLNLRRVTLYDAISIVTELAGLDFMVDDRNVVILRDGKAISERK